LNHLDVLKKAREVISDPAAWTQGSSARDEEGRSCSPDSYGAVCFCSIGACDLASKVLDAVDCYGTALGALRNFMSQKGYDRYIADFNDRSNHAEVLAIFDETIKYEESLLGQL
jgi:hypothetical protein